MPRSPRMYLWDVREAADAIADFIAGVDLPSYKQTEIVRAAVERKFEIIGEALSQLSKLDPILAERIPELGEVVGFRNILIHGYASINHDRVLVIARTKLPALRSVVEAMLSELDA
jgi:uncharacterized protein with HEPN domain